MGYRFVTLDDFDLYDPQKQAILRHDVDYSPQKALELARIDRSLRVRSTFFILLRGQSYNFLGHHTQRRVREIHAMGFPIGLHYAAPPDIGDDHQAHRQQLLRDFQLMRSEFPEAYPAFSWHIPPPLALQGSFSAPDGMVDLYSQRYFQQIKYASDSSLRNSYEHLMQIFISGEHQKVQLVLHPECWVARREMHTLADMIGEILRSVTADAEAALREVPGYKDLLPSGMPPGMLDQIRILFVDAVRMAKNHRFGRQ
ncbi:MAG TPA: hypothetical protein VMW58_13715 [Anaerolineae bacterium]|nr:hypothetical protein [Anaerolineae bacterium]